MDERELCGSIMRPVASVATMWLDTSSSGYPGEAVDRLTGDVLFLRGDDDHLFTRQAAGDLASRLEGSSFANIASAGHGAHEDQPEIVLRSINEFLTRSSDPHDGGAA